MTKPSVEVSCVLVRRTPDAVLIDLNPDDEYAAEQVWIPRSCLEDFDEDFGDGDDVDLYVHEWKAEEVGLV